MTALYRIYGEERLLLYVGITDHYDQRMRQHAEKAWWVDVRAIEVTEYPDRKRAQSAERLAIGTEHPKHNRSHTSKPARDPYVPRARKRPATRRWLNQAEAAEYLGVTDRTIRNYIRRGTVRGYRLPGSRLIRLDANELDEQLRPVPSAKDGAA